MMILIFKISLSNPTNDLNFKIYDVKTWSKNSHISHIAQYLRNQANRQ